MPSPSSLSLCGRRYQKLSSSKEDKKGWKYKNPVSMRFGSGFSKGHQNRIEAQDIDFLREDDKNGGPGAIAWTATIEGRPIWL
jgi:hypothetical protein